MENAAESDRNPENEKWNTEIRTFLLAYLTAKVTIAPEMPVHLMPHLTLIIVQYTNNNNYIPK